jgi:hypothetical protein
VVDVGDLEERILRKDLRSLSRDLFKRIQG